MDESEENIRTEKIEIKIDEEFDMYFDISVEGASKEQKNTVIINFVNFSISDITIDFKNTKNGYSVFGAMDIEFEDEWLNMARKVEKVTAKVGDATLQRRGLISFPDKYKKWQQECRNLGPSKVGGKVNLLAWLKKQWKPSLPNLLEEILRIRVFLV